MRFVFGWAVLVVTLGVLHCTPEDLPTGISEDTLKKLSLDGEKLVDEEVRKALHGVKQMKEIMVKNEEKHEHLMKSLRHSNDKKKGASELTQEVTEKLEEAEEQCKISLQSEWEECRPCLEDACKTFYTSTCRRGFSTFRVKVENFFRRVSSRFSPREQRPLVVEGSVDDVVVNQSSENSDVEVVRIEDSFSRLLTKVTSLFNRSRVLVSRIQNKLDSALQKAFSPKLKDQVKPTEDPFSPDRDSAFLKGVGLEEVLDSFFDFGKSVVEEFGAVVTQVFDDLHDAVEEESKKEKDLFPRFLQNRKLCRDLRRQTSECWQLQNQCEACQGALLTECPSVRELHVELDEVSQLLEVSKEQYDEILGIVQRHTEDTVSWLSNMDTEFSWVAELADSTNMPKSLFRITTVSQTSDGDNALKADTKVEVNILNSPSLILTVPAEIKLQDPTFIQYVTQEALGMYKQMVRHEDE
ncbi:clusterin-like protein 1 [Hypomesus transpacificus]|uniref:clusterin-like protein 1 n=1 Tax=Hypomesus transpacificus TaxID=137520 RepID=UPI001F0733B3|nr:clusterin-like protein 1 [Hypomesus transpacificus]